MARFKCCQCTNDMPAPQGPIHALLSQVPSQTRQDFDSLFDSLPTAYDFSLSDKLDLKTSSSRSQDGIKIELSQVQGSQASFKGHFLFTKKKVRRITLCCDNCNHCCTYDIVKK